MRAVEDSTANLPCMKTTLLPLIVAALLTLSGATAQAVDSYQVTGEIVELTDTKIVVVKGAEKERFEVTRSAETKVTGELKVGGKATVHYRMTAASIEAKPEKK